MRTAMIAITTRSSIKVKPRRVLVSRFRVIGTPPFPTNVRRPITSAFRSFTTRRRGGLCRQVRQVPKFDRAAVLVSAADGKQEAIGTPCHAPDQSAKSTDASDLCVSRRVPDDHLVPARRREP